MPRLWWHHSHQSGWKLPISTVKVQIETVCTDSRVLTQASLTLHSWGHAWVTITTIWIAQSSKCISRHLTTLTSESMRSLSHTHHSLDSRSTIVCRCANPTPHMAQVASAVTTKRGSPLADRHLPVIIVALDLPTPTKYKLGRKKFCQRNTLPFLRNPPPQPVCRNLLTKWWTQRFLPAHLKLSSKSY